LHRPSIAEEGVKNWFLQIASFNKTVFLKIECHQIVVWVTRLENHLEPQISAAIEAKEHPLILNTGVGS